MRVLIVSEGKHEIGSLGQVSALEILVSRLLGRKPEFERRKVSDPEVHAHRQPGIHDGYEKRALAWMRFAERMGYCAIVLLVDEDEQKHRRLELDKAQDNAKIEVRRALGIAVRTFDAWFLADEKALSTVLCRIIPCQRNPEKFSEPKEQCRKLLDGSPAVELSTAEFYAQVARHVDLEVLETRCEKGFQTFAYRVRALANSFCT